MSIKITPRWATRRRQDGVERPECSCKSRTMQTHMQRAELAWRAAAVAATLVTLVGAGACAQAAAAEGSGGEDAAVEAACKVAAERAAAAVKRLLPLSEHVPGQGHATRVRGAKRKAHRQAQRASRQAVVAVAGWPTVMTDSIGPYTFVLLANDEGQSNCVVGPNLTEPPGGISAGFGEPNISVGANQIGRIALGFERAHNFKPFSYIDGRTGSGVTAVNFTLQDGGHVPAELANGWFLAFWEGSEHAATVEIVSARGTSTKSFYDPSAHED